MTDKDFNSEQLDEAIGAIKGNVPHDDEMSAAIARTRAAIATQRGPQGLAAASPAVERFDSMADFIAAIPAYLAGELTEAQQALFEEESRSSFPLRRALEEARSGGAEESEALPAGTPTHRWWAAAAAVAAVAVTLVLALPELPSFNQAQLAQVAAVEGDLYQIRQGRLEALAPGSWIDGRQRIRSASGSSAVITLDDGSQIEIDERSELSMTRRGSGNRVDVSRGRVLVVASPQGSGTLDVFTDEFMVSVTGTIFEVAHGAKGSRVAVIEGSVDVLLAGNTTSLTPGEIMASRADRLAVNIEDEIAWSQNADLYIDMLQEVAALQQDLEAVLATQPRYSTRLLDLAPANTAVYIAVPNAPEKIADVYEVIRTRMQGSQFLGQAWADFEANAEMQYIDLVMTWLREIGYALGEETVVALTMPEDASAIAEGEGVGAPLILSEVDAEAFRAAFESQMDQLQAVLAAEGLDHELEIALVDDPADAVDGGLSILLYEDILVAGIDAASLMEMQAVLDSGASDFTASPLHGLLQQSYAQGTEMLGAVDIASFIEPLELTEAGGNELGQTGLANAEYLIAQHSQADGITTITADLYFAGEREGAMAWLATPGSMGSLEFFSTDTTIAAAILLDEPANILEQLGPIELPEGVDAQAELELFYSVIGELGGEFAIGLDGPALPTPSWKVVVEAYDAQLLQEGIEWSVARVGAEMGQSASLDLIPADVAGYEGYQLVLSDPQASIGLDSVSFNYAFVDGYLLASANAALIDRAISYYESGAGLQSDSEFQELLARDGYLDFSALYFSRLGELVNDVVQSLPATLSPEQQASLDALDTEVGPSLTSLLALPDKIHFAHSGSSQLPIQMLSQLVALEPLLESVADQAQSVQ